MALLVALQVVQLYGYPISPRPLRMLIQESTYILSGRVLSVQEKPITETDNGRLYAIANIEVHRVFKGQCVASCVEVIFTPHMICPAPAYYVPNAWVMVFLDDAQPYYVTHALSYGSKNLTPDDLEVYTQRVLEMQQILALSDLNAQRLATIEWLVQCAAHPATQWEGLYELSPQSDFMSFYDKRTSSESFALTPSQLERLWNVLQAKPKLDMGDFGLIDLVYQGHEHHIDAQLLAALARMAALECIFAREYMLRLQHVLPAAKARRLLRRAERFDFESIEQPQIKKVIRQFVAAVQKHAHHLVLQNP